MDEVKFPAEILVKAGKRKKEIEFADGKIVVSVKARAEKGEANMEVVKVLSKHFGKQVRIVSGFTSKRKVIDVL